MKVRYTVLDGEIAEENRNGVITDYVADPLGSTVALLDGSHTKSDTFNYWPYGEVQSRSGSTATPFQFVGTLGYYRDSSSRTYVRARYYRQALGRWQTVDKYFPWLAAFTYADSSPGSLVDPNGKLSIPPVYGNFCGPQSKFDWWERPINELDACCKIHDIRWGQHGCSAYNQYLNPDCVQDTLELCTCLTYARCPDKECELMRKSFKEYACGYNAIPFVFWHCVDAIESWVNALAGGLSLGGGVRQPYEGMCCCDCGFGDPINCDCDQQTSCTVIARRPCSINPIRK